MYIPPSTGFDPDIIGTVQQLAAVIVHQHIVASIRIYLPYFSMHIGTSDEVSVAVKR